MFCSRHVDGDRTIPHTSQATHLCGVGDGSGGLAVLVCACWSLDVLLLFLHLVGCLMVLCLLFWFTYLLLVDSFSGFFVEYTVFWLVCLFTCFS